MVVLPAVFLLVPSEVAAADPLSSARAQAAALSAQIAGQAGRMSQLDEEYNQATIKAAQLDSQVSAAQGQLALAQSRVASLETKLRKEAVQAFIAGGTAGSSASDIGALFQSSESSLALKRHYLNTISSHDQDTIADLRTARDHLEAKQAALQSAQQASHQAVDAVAQARQEAQAQAEQEQATLNQVNGQIATLVAEQQAAQAAAQARLMQQRIAQSQAAQQSAAQQSAAQTKSQQQSQSQPAQANPSQAPASPGGPASSQPTASPGPPASAPAPSPAPAPAPTPTPSPAPSWSPPPASGSAGSVAVAAAERYLGVPYVWGGAGPGGFDCSGLTMVAWGAAGVSLPHSAAAQYADIAHISLASLQPGDLIFYDFGGGIDHVVMYVGGGQIIQAAHTGTVVSIGPMFYSGLVGAGRP